MKAKRKENRGLPLYGYDLWRYLALLAFSMGLFAEGNTQNIGINEDGSDPHSSAILHLKSTNKGFLVPRLSLDNVRTESPVSDPASGLLIHNSGGTEPPGFYYWDENKGKWKRLLSGSDDTGEWETVNNGAGIVPTDRDHRVGIGTSDPSRMLEVNGNIQLSGDEQWIGAGSTIERMELDKSRERFDFREVDLELDPGQWFGTGSTRERIHFSESGEFISLLSDDADFKVGIETLSPRHELDVSGSLGIEDTLHHNDDPDTYFLFRGDATEFYAGGKKMLSINENEGTVDISGDVEISGDANVTGTLSKGGGSFRIDHPLAPRKKYLYHSFVESDRMLNIYSGTVTTDSAGRATIELPPYFDRANKDPRYQLTPVGQRASPWVAREVRDNAFVVRTREPGVQVSWEVTAVRDDAFARKHRIEPVQMKKGEERGELLHPDVPVEDSHSE